MTMQNLSNLSHHTDMNRCDLYPIIPAHYPSEDAFALLPSILTYEAVTALRFCFNQAPSRKVLTSLITITREHNTALIIAPQKAQLLSPSLLHDIDGIHFSSPEEMKLFLSTQKKNLPYQVGSSCRNLDEAMQAGERGADYISLPVTEQTSLTQWNLITELPAVAENILSHETAQAAVHAGADFLGIPLPQNEKEKQTFIELLRTLS